MRKIRVLVVDDSTVVRRLVTDVLATDPELELAGIAANGRIAIAKIPQICPDVVTLDMEMPELDGLSTLKEIRKTHPRLPVIMFSTLCARGACATLDALSAGANDYVTKPANVGSVMAGMQSVREKLIPKIKALCPWREASSADKPVSLRKNLAPLIKRAWNPSACEIVVIGVSTGGPNALAQLLAPIPASFPAPIVVVQHMPPVFTHHLAERLDAKCALKVREGSPGEAIHPGEVWIAPGDYHLTLSRVGGRIILQTNQQPPENSCRPAVDVLFRSAAEVFGPRCLSVILTGMGQDGLRGAEIIIDRGGRLLAQDEASSVVWGMPGAVVQAGLADAVLPLADISDQLLRDVTVVRPKLSSTISSR